MTKMNRRGFIQKSSLSAAALAAVPGALAGDVLKDRPAEARYMGDFAAPKLEKIRMAFIGVGYRGNDHMKFSASLEGTEVVRSQTFMRTMWTQRPRQLKR